MKKILFSFVIAVLMLMGGNVFSQGSMLTIMSDNGEKFTLEVNGHTQNQEPGDQVSAYDLNGPTIKVKVFIEGIQAPPVSKTVFNKPNGEFYYALRKNAKGIYVLETVSSNYTPAGKAATPSKETKTTETTTTTATEATTQAAKAGCTVPLTNEEFAVLYAQVSARPFEGTQVSAIKNLVVDKCVTSQQVQELLYILNMESTRLDVAKYSYIHVYDPGNYSVIDEVFRSASSVESLHKHIASKK